MALIARIKKTIIAAGLTAALVLSAGCLGGPVPNGAEDTGGYPASSAPEPPSVSEPVASATPALDPPPHETAASTAAPRPSRGGGTVAYAEGVDRLTPSQERLILEFMNAYYTTLAYLDVQDVSELFAPDAMDQADNNRIVWEVLVGVRSMQKNDLSLSAYSFTLTVQTADEQESGDITVRVQEDFIQNFSAWPGVDSKGFNVGHNFTLTNTDDGWRISRHRQSDSLNNSLLGRWNFGATTVDMPETQIEQRRDNLISEARLAVSGRSEQGSAPEDDITYDNEYDRDAAVSYAREWADARNPDWQAYDRMGGNCQNFTSQAILAGGIPMDCAAPAQWKWYGDTPSSSFLASGRSPSWSGVSEFLDYVESNSGYGMVAVANAPYYSGEPGDIVHLGTGGEWRHTVIITQVMKDADGETVDYLIASNTANLLDFPVSAYYYQEQMLIKIYGWNN